jgi:S1-C subfamily serine protease
MDIEKLTKQQIILITLLVSFVTSIATGIVTVALMDQAPPGVVQTINRVVEKTIEKVITPPVDSNNSAAVMTRETIVIKEDDKIIESVNKNKNSIVRIYTDNTGDVSQNIFIGLGTIISKDGLIATGDVFADQNGQYIVTLDNNKFYDVKVLPKKESDKFYFLKVVQSKENLIDFVPVTLSNSDSLKLGQTVMILSGEKQNSVSAGIISSLINSATNLENVIAINTNIGLVDSLSGSPLLNLNGEMVGIRVSLNISKEYNFLPANDLENQIKSLNTI